MHGRIAHNIVVLPAKWCSTRSESYPQDSKDTVVFFASKSFTAEADLQANTNDTRLWIGMGAVLAGVRGCEDGNTGKKKRGKKTV